MLRVSALIGLAGALGLASPMARAADACDTLSARVIRDTGASLAGRAGPVAVFRAQDAARMSLDCRAPARITIASRDREPSTAYFVLIGLAARAVAGADAATAEVLALNLHQASLLADAPRRGGTGAGADAVRDRPARRRPAGGPHGLPDRVPGRTFADPPQGLDRRPCRASPHPVLSSMSAARASPTTCRSR